MSALSVSETLDTLVIGAGVVGLAVARALAQNGRDVLVLEQNSSFGEGTSSRNSEVIHAGIYYPPGSLKARLCVRGKALLYTYLEQRGIAHRQCGKLIVASNDKHTEMLRAYAARAQQNGVDDLEWLSAGEIRAIEPSVQAVAGLHSPSTGILDTHALMSALLGDLEAAGGQAVFRHPVEAVSRDTRGLQVRCGSLTLSPALLVNCAGLSAPLLARGVSAGDMPDGFLAKGHYYTLRGASPFSRLIYPVAEAGGLGIHVTLDLQGRVRFGPDVRWVDSVDYAFDDTRRGAFIDAIRRYYPDLDTSRLDPGYTGIRPKIVRPGEPDADFHIAGPADHGVAGLINLLGIESPGITASLAIAEYVCALSNVER